MSMIKGKAGAVKPRIGARAAASSAPRFQYKPRSPEQVRERASRSIGGRDSFFTQDVQFFTPRQGENTVRILPPPPDADWGHYGLNLALHYQIGADQSAYLCRNKMKDEPCPLCEERDRASGQGEEDLADALKPSYRVAVYVIDRAQESKGPLLWSISAGLDKDITKLCIDPASGEVLPVDDPNDGYDLIFTREGEGLKTKYKGIQFARRASPLTDDAEDGEKWLDYVVKHRIDECLQFHEYDYVQKVYEGQAPAAADEKPEKEQPAKRGAVKEKKDEAPAPARAKIKPRGAPAPEPEPDDGPRAGEGDDCPTWDELEALDEDGLAQLGEEAQIEFPEAGFESLEELRQFVADRLGVQKPKEEPAPAAKSGGWRERLAKLNKK